MQSFRSLLVLMTLICPVMCQGGIDCCQERGHLSPSHRAACCTHCGTQGQQDYPAGDVPLPPGRPCTCSCLCGGAVLAESVSLPDLPVVGFVMDLWVPMPPQSVGTGIVWDDSYGYDRCLIAGYSLRILECSLRC